MVSAVENDVAIVESDVVMAVIAPGSSVIPDTPAWFQQLVPEYQPRNIWAPDISYFGGQYHLYYSVSSFGSNRSLIGGDGLHPTPAGYQLMAQRFHLAISNIFPVRGSLQ